MDEENNKGAGDGNPPEIKENREEAAGRHWIFSGYVKNGVLASLGVSLAILVMYMAGSMPDTGFPDNILFLFLRLLRYSSLLLCAFSLFAMADKVRRLVNSPGIKNALKLLFYFFTGMLGAVFAMLYSFIVAASEGNV